MPPESMPLSDGLDAVKLKLQRTIPPSQIRVIRHIHRKVVSHTTRQMAYLRLDFRRRKLPRRRPTILRWLNS